MPAEIAETNEDSTRDQLLDAAEELFIKEGLNGASLRAIGRRAGQRNASALQYHFENRDGLILALLGRRMNQLEELRRNLAVSGINLLGLRDARFSIGEVVLQGSGAHCPSCGSGLK